MEITSLYDPYAIHFDTFAGDVYTLSTASITLTTGTISANQCGLAAGTVGAPSLFLTGAVTTGVNLVVANDTVALVSDGADKLHVNSSNIVMDIDVLIPADSRKIWFGAGQTTDYDICWDGAFGCFGVGNQKDTKLGKDLYVLNGDLFFTTLTEYIGSDNAGILDLNAANRIDFNIGGTQRVNITSADFTAVTASIVCQINGANVNPAVFKSRKNRVGATVGGDDIGSFQAEASYVLNTYAVGGELLFEADGAWSNAGTPSSPTMMSFWTCPTGSTTRVRRATIRQTGDIELGISPNFTNVAADGDITFSGTAKVEGLKINTVAKTANYDLAATDDVIICGAGNQTFTVDVPAPTGDMTGKVFHIKNVGTGTITVDANVDGSSTIDDGATASITVQYECISIVSDGSEWWIL